MEVRGDKGTMRELMPPCVKMPEESISGRGNNTRKSIEKHAVQDMFGGAFHEWEGWKG